METQKDPTIASFDFGAYGKIELTKTKLIGSVISARMPGQTSGRQASMKGEKSEFRAKLDQVQNFEVQPPKSFAKKIFSLLWFGLPIACPLVGVCIGLGFLLGLMFGGIIAMSIVGGLAGIGLLVWFAIFMWKSMSRAYLVFSVNGSDMNARCEGNRLPELEEFVRLVKKTQADYLDTI